MNSTEEWKVIHGVHISNWGRTKTDRISPYYPSIGRAGYRCIGRNGKMWRIARLVAEAFLGLPPSSLHTVDHVDCNRANNYVTNLRWASKSEQRMNQGERTPDHDIIPVQVRKKSDTMWTTCASTTDAAKLTNVNASNVNRVCNGRRKQDSGYVFRWLVEDPIPGEIWKSFMGVDVSSEGRKRLANGSIFTPRPAPSMIYAVCRVKGLRTSWHVVVCSAFHGERPYTSATVDHINGDVTDNRACNLRWASKSLQSTNITRQPGGRKMIIKPIVGRRIGTTEWQDFESANSAARILNLSGGNITACCRMRYHHTGNWEFKYKTHSPLTGSVTDLSLIRKQQIQKRSKR